MLKEVVNAMMHETAHVSPDARIGDGARLWINVQVREFADIGADCILSKDVYVDRDVKIGDRCKIQNSVSIYKGVTLEEEVFVGPNVSFTNDRVPRTFHPNWEITPTHVEKGASIGANATIVCGVTIGEYAMIAAGSVVTKDVAPYSLVMGNPARHFAFVDKDGNRLSEKNK